MTKKTTTITTREYDASGKLVKETVTTTVEEETYALNDWTYTQPTFVYTNGSSDCTTTLSSKGE